MRIITATALFVMLSVAVLAAGDSVRVVGNRVNLRARPDGSSDVVGQVSEGTVLEVLGVEGDWTQVVPPDGVGLWVYGELVQDGVVAVPKLMVRGGPGINYKAVGHLVEGDKVTARGEQSGWVRVAPPKGSYAWISGEYVQSTSARATPPPGPAVSEPTPARATPPPRSAVSEPTPARDAVKPAVSAARPVAPSVVMRSVPVTAVPVRPATEGATRSAPRRLTVDSSPPTARDAVGHAPPPSIDQRHLVPSREQGRHVTMQGALRPTARAVWRRPSEYRLVQRDRQGRSLTVCYVLGNPDRLDALLDRSVAVSGREYWVQGVLHPVLTADRISDAH